MVELPDKVDQRLGELETALADFETWTVRFTENDRSPSPISARYI